MIRRTLVSRLKRLEDLIAPEQKVTIHNINFVDADGTVVETMQIVHGRRQSDLAVK